MLRYGNYLLAMSLNILRNIHINDANTAACKSNTGHFKLSNILLKIGYENGYYNGLITRLRQVKYTLKMPFTTAADDKFCAIFPKFPKNKV